MDHQIALRQAPLSGGLIWLGHVKTVIVAWFDVIGGSISTSIRRPWS